MFDRDRCLLRFKAKTSGCGHCIPESDDKECICIQFAQGLEVPEEFKKGAPALRLLKGLYGLQQAPRLWNDAVNATLHYVRKEKSEFVIIALYVDDLILTSNSSDLLSKVKVALKENYKMTDLGELSWCLGIQVAQCQGSVRLTQRTYILKMLERFGMQDCKPCKTPAAAHFKKDCLSAGEILCEEDTQRYQSIIGSLMYAMIGTRPDIAFVLSELSKYVSKPGKNHLIAAKRVLRYLQVSKDYHLEFSRGKATEKFSLYGYCDASRSCQKDGSSVTDFVFKVLTGPVSWCAKKQATIALSTAEAEYVALSHAVNEGIWLRHFLKDLGYLQLDANPIYEDNQACIKIAKND